jgi:hypothetical protein
MKVTIKYRAVFGVAENSIAVMEIISHNESDKKY